MPYSVSIVAVSFGVLTTKWEEIICLPILAWSSLRSFDDAAKEVGGKLIGFYLVLGQYDYVVITEAPDDQTAARLILGTIAQGSVRTQTMRAFPREEFEQIARGL